MEASGEYDLTDLLNLLVNEQAEALDIRPGRPPGLIIRGEPELVEGPAVSLDNTELLLREVADTRQLRELRESHAVTFIYTFRGNVLLRVEAISEPDGIQFQIHRIAL